MALRLGRHIASRARSILWDGQAAHRVASRVGLPGFRSHRASERRALAVAVMFAASSQRTRAGWQSARLSVGHVSALLGLPKRLVERSISQVERWGWWRSWQAPPGEGRTTGPSGFTVAIRRWSAHCAPLRSWLYATRDRRTQRARADLPRPSRPRPAPLPVDPVAASSAQAYERGLEMLRACGLAPPT